jgi:ABC-2 type transport system permease protein
MAPLVRYAGIWLAQIRYTIMRELMFKANFILWVFVDLSWFGLNLSFIQFLYLQVNTVAGWNKWEMILLVSTNMLIQQIFQMFLMTNLTKLPELVRTGRLDFFLAQPASAQFLVSTRYFELGSVVLTLVSAIVCVIAIAHLNMSFSGVGLLVFPTLVA